MLLTYLDSNRTDNTIEDNQYKRGVKLIHGRPRSASTGKGYSVAKEPSNMFAKIIRGPPIQTAAKLLNRSITISYEQKRGQSRANEQNLKNQSIFQNDVVVNARAGVPTECESGSRSQLDREQASNTLKRLPTDDASRYMQGVFDVADAQDPVFTIPINTHKLVRKTAAGLECFDPAKTRQNQKLKATQQHKTVLSGPQIRTRAASVDRSAILTNPNSLNNSMSIEPTAIRTITYIRKDKKGNIIDKRDNPAYVKNDEETPEQHLDRKLAELEKENKSRWVQETTSNELLFKVCHFPTSKGVRSKRVRPRTASVDQSQISSNTSLTTAKFRPSSSKDPSQEYSQDPTHASQRMNNIRIRHNRHSSFDSRAGYQKVNNIRSESIDSQSTMAGSNTISLTYDGMRDSIRPSIASVVNVSTFLGSSRPSSAFSNDMLYNEKQRPMTALSHGSQAAVSNSLRLSSRQIPSPANHCFSIDTSLNRVLSTSFNSDFVNIRPLSGHTVNKNEFMYPADNILEEIPEDQSVRDEKTSNITYSLQKDFDPKGEKSVSDLESFNEGVNDKTSLNEMPVIDTKVGVSTASAGEIKKPPKHFLANSADYAEYVNSVKERNKELENDYILEAHQALEEDVTKTEESLKEPLTNFASKAVVRQATLGADHKTTMQILDEDRGELKELKIKLENIQEKWDLLISQEEKYQATEDTERAKHDYYKDECLRGSTARVTVEELMFIRNEFKRPKKDIQYGKIDDIIARLKFFARIHRDIRLALLREAAHVQYKRGQTIFNLGDYGDLMFIIIRGGCDVKIPQKTLNPGQLITVVSLYDGAHFGELAMIGSKTRNQNAIDLPEIQSLSEIPRAEDEKKKKLLQKEQKLKLLQDKKKKAPVVKLHYEGRDFEEIDEAEHEVNKERNQTLRKDLGIEEKDQEGKKYFQRTRRAATIDVSEDCDLFAIDRDTFRELFVSVLQKDIDSKIKVLMLLPFFRNEESFKIIPLANNLTSVKFKYGQRILTQGNVPQCFYVVASGRCSVVYEHVKTAAKIPRHTDKLKPFRFQLFGKTINTKPLSEQKKQEKLITEECEEYHQRDFARRTFDNDPYVCPTNNKVVQHIVCKELRKGECFGLRAILSQDDEQTYLNDERNSAKLTIIADSPVVEIYTLDRKHLMFIPDHLQALLKSGISKMSDFDDYDIDKARKENANWNRFKHDIMIQTLQSNDSLQRGFHVDYKAY